MEGIHDFQLELNFRNKHQFWPRGVPAQLVRERDELNGSIKDAVNARHL